MNEFVVLPNMTTTFASIRQVCYQVRSDRAMGYAHSDLSTNTKNIISTNTDYLFFQFISFLYQSNDVISRSRQVLG